MRFSVTIFLTITFIALGSVWLGDQGPDPVSAAPEVFPGTLNGSCYLATSSSCKLRVDPFSIIIGAGAQLEAFKLQANGVMIYDFRTDVSNPPVGSYTPSRVKLDFAAVCNRDYVVTLHADDTSQTNFLNIGQTKTISCPEGRYEHYLPFIKK